MNGQKRGRTEGGRSRWYKKGRRQGEVEERVGRRDGKELIWQQVGSGIEARKERDTRTDRRREADMTEDGMMTTLGGVYTMRMGIEIKKGV